MASAQPTSRETLLDRARSIDWQNASGAAWRSVRDFGLDLKNPPSAIAFGGCVLIILSAVLQFLLFDPNRIRAFAPPSPTRVQIEQASKTALEFSTIPPTQRGDAASGTRP